MGNDCEQDDEEPKKDDKKHKENLLQDSLLLVCAQRTGQAHVSDVRLSRWQSTKGYRTSGVLFNLLFFVCMAKRKKGLVSAAHSR